jgi:glycosyltransferase involved in cell wall biosynthesis
MIEPLGVKSIPKTAFVILYNGAFGGSVTRFTNLYIYLNNKFPDKFYFLINTHLYNQIEEIYPGVRLSNVRILRRDSARLDTAGQEGALPRYYSGTVPDPEEVDRKTSFARKIYWYYKNKLSQYLLFRKIEKLRKGLGIEVFIGVFAGILPLVFYLNKPHRNAAVIFSDMDSWFTDVFPDMKKFWYRKYFSFTYAVENCDVIDFLSPYIREGIEKRGIRINKESVYVAPCSFADYSKCKAGNKGKMEIAFAARLEPNKNPMLYLEAAKQVLQKHPGVRFHLLGEGTLVKEINDFILSNGLKDKINFRFHKNPPEIFAETSVFVSLQRYTNYPSQSVLEAMACGNAVIASDVGDTRLLINEQTGVLIPIRLAEIVSALDRLIINPGLALRLGKSAREFVLKNHTIEKYSDYCLGLADTAYNKILNNKK